jgi:Skp family chaperone for outer membrane proteins
MQRNLILTILGLCLAATAFPQEKETQFAFNNYHRYYNEARQRGMQRRRSPSRLSALPLRSILTVIIPWTPG